MISKLELAQKRAKGEHLRFNLSRNSLSLALMGVNLEVSASFQSNSKW